ncbi:MAG: 16S rRNA (uracil(1498)-N(3))-methyltransferase [Lachnospiraceae bacterium]|nr:16S rRNA (uracil(1498)-N(3))-methyltransferase [Lachnospiraceae bacterium]
MYQFFVKPQQIVGTTVYITGKDVNHIKNVLRMKPGEEVAVKTGTDEREYRCAIRALGEEQIELELRFVKEDGLELPCRVFLFQGLPKSDKMEYIIQKAVELGVYEIIPVRTRRAVVKLDEKKAQQKVNRWQGIAEAAAKQSKRGIIPQICDVMSFEQALSYAQDMQVKMIPYELAKGMGETRALIAGIKPGESVAVFIGPEGGFDEAEIEAACACGIKPVSLGRRILRTETAGMTVLAFLLYQMEE